MAMITSLYFDLKSAYDIVNRQKIMLRARSILPACPCGMISLTLSIMILEPVGDPSPTTAKFWLRVLQGYSLSLILLSIYIESSAIRRCAGLPRLTARAPGRLFADDV